MLIEQLIILTIIGILLVNVGIGTSFNSNDIIRFNNSLEYSINLGINLSSKINKNVYISYRSDLKELLLFVDKALFKSIYAPARNVNFTNISIYPSGHISPMSYYINDQHYSVSTTGKINYKNES
jgi:hypothetical protein